MARTVLVTHQSLAVARHCLPSTRVSFSPPLCSLQQVSGCGQAGSDTAGQNWPKGYSRLYTTTLGNKKWGKGEQRSTGRWPLPLHHLFPLPCSSSLMKLSLSRPKRFPTFAVPILSLAPLEGAAGWCSAAGRGQPWETAEPWQCSFGRVLLLIIY